MASRPRPRTSPRRIDAASIVVLAAFAFCCACVALVRGVPAWVSLLYAGASALCFAFHAIDKQAAIRGRGRISEAVLLSLGLVGGWPGAIVAQQVLRHKTAKRAFRVRFWITVAANVTLFVLAMLAPHSFERGA